jgi:Flp pilus assembly protein TadD, contains TPR repeats
VRVAVIVAVAMLAHAFAAEPDFVPEVAREAAAEGNAAFEKGDFAAAAKAYRRAVELAPGNIVGLVNLGMAEARLGHYEEAEKVLHEAVKQRLETGAAWLALGMMYYEQRRYDDALAALAQAARYDSANPRAHHYLGVVMGAKGWLDGAADELRRAVRIDPAYRDAHYNLAVVYLQQRPPSIELARRHYYRSIELGGPPDREIEKTLSTPPAAR